MLFDFKLSCSVYTRCKNAAAKWYHVSLAQQFSPTDFARSRQSCDISGESCLYWISCFSILVFSSCNVGITRWRVSWFSTANFFFFTGKSGYTRTRKASTQPDPYPWKGHSPRTATICRGYGSGRVYPRVRVYPQTSNVHSTAMCASRFRCLIGVINKLTMVELCISPVYRRLAVAKFSKSTM